MWQSERDERGRAGADVGVCVSHLFSMAQGSRRITHRKVDVILD